MHGPTLIGIRFEGFKEIGAIIRDAKLASDATYIAYLPLAHVLEFYAECIMMTLGAGVGYS